MSVIIKIENNTKIPVNEFNIIFLIAGSISIQTDENEYEIEKKTFFYYNKDFKITSSSPYLNGFIISLSKEYIIENPSIEKYVSENLEYFKPSKLIDTNSFKTLLETIPKENKSNKELIVNYINIILLKLKSNNVDKKNQKSKLYNQFIDLIKENIENNYCAGSYAKLLNIPLKTLIAEVKQETNKTPCNVITEQVIKKSKQLLLTTSNSSKMIAYQLGFQEPYYFIKYFKKNVGVTPTQFRKEH